MKTYIWIYLLVVALLMGCAYGALAYLYSFFFEERKPVFTKRSLFSLGYIMLSSVLISVISYSIHDRTLGNRMLHIFGGGFLSYMVCYLAAKDTKLSIDRLHFVVFSFLVVTSLGVANEILEFLLQKYLHFMFAESMYDTWLDLVSNTLGIVLAAACTISFMPRSIHFHHE